MKNYHLKVLSPDGEVFDGEVISLSLRGAEGDLMVMSGHIPFITTCKPGKCVITLPDESEMEGDLVTGVLDVGKDDVTLLVGDRKLFVK